MPKSAHFKVDPRLASLLGATYRSSEHALKELVDNAWDADAESVRISLPGPMTSEPIVITDDGAGMTEQEIRAHYLAIANDRRSRGDSETTRRKRRLVKGHKGIGKFAGLMTAETMRIQTRADGVLTSLTITKKDLLAAVARHQDLEKVPLDLITDPCAVDEHGTTIELRDLNRNLALPNPERLKELLVLEYGRQSDFVLLVNGEPVTVEAIQGPTFNEEVEIEGAGTVRLRFTISDGKKALKGAGIAIRVVGGKIIGKPTALGLEDDEHVPSKLLGRIYGEIDAHGLAREDITADWGAIIENSKGYQAVRAWAAGKIKEQLDLTCKREMDLQRARLARENKLRLQRLPEHRRRFAEEQIDKIIRRFYNENEDRIDAIVSVLLDALERDEYWEVIKHIEKARQSDVAALAEALVEFGIVDMMVMYRQAKHRLALLDEIDRLIADPATLERQLHKIIERNPWILGAEFSTLYSNQTLGRIVEELVEKTRAKNRPDLLLAQKVRERYVLVEFKRPSETITREHELQAIEYRDDLATKFSPIDVLLIGKARAQTVAREYETAGVRVLSYAHVLSTARRELDWLLQQLATP